MRHTTTTTTNNNNDNDNDNDNDNRNNEEQPSGSSPDAPFSRTLTKVTRILYILPYFA